MRSSCRAFLLIFPLAAVFIFPHLVIAGDATPSTQPQIPPVKTGNRRVTFTERSPLSDFPKLIERLGGKDIGGDYDLTREPFVQYIPTNYDPGVPCGIIFWIWSDGTSETFQSLRPFLEKHHLIFIAPVKDHLPVGTATGLCLDAVYNLQKKYSIDPSRIYLFGMQPARDFGLFTGDIFAGDVYLFVTSYFRPIQAHGRIYPPNRPVVPSAALLTIAKKRPQILTYPKGDAEWMGQCTAVAGAMRENEFEHVYDFPLADAQATDPQWLEQTLALLENPNVKPGPSSRPDPAEAKIASANPQTGDSLVTFTERSPESVPVKLALRLDPDGRVMNPDYNLAEQPYWVHVPADYDGSTPYGVVVWLGDKGSIDSGPTSLTDPLQKHRLIFIAAKNTMLPLTTEMGMSLDAVYNLKKRYNIDDRRVYLMGFGFPQNVALTEPDVFMGGVYIWYIGYYRPISVGKDRTLRLYGLAPSQEMRTLAKKRVHILGYEAEHFDDGVVSLIPGAMTDDGYEHVSKLIVDPGDVKYPNINPEWFDKMITSLETIAPATEPTGLIATGEPSEAEHLLRKAKLDIDNNRTDLAKDLLSQLLEKYPNDPQADAARQLLTQIGGQ